MDTSTSEMLVAMGSVQLDEFYPAVAVGALMRIARDPSLSAHHTFVIQVNATSLLVVTKPDTPQSGVREETESSSKHCCRI